MAKIDPVFTRISQSLADRDDGLVYTTADRPGGIFGIKPGRSFAIYVLPAQRFGLSRLDLSELALTLPPKLEANHAGEVFSAQVPEPTPMLSTGVPHL